MQAVSLALSSQDIALVHGPPGTGKHLTPLQSLFAVPEKSQPQTCLSYMYARQDQILARCVQL